MGGMDRRGGSRLAQASGTPGRDHSRQLKERTVTNLHHGRPQWLIDAHLVLDAAVAAAYGWNSEISKELVLWKLLDMNYQNSQT